MSYPLDDIVGSCLTRRGFVQKTMIGGLATTALLSTMPNPLVRRASAADQSPLAHRFITTNGIRMHIAEQGQGPLVILCHGFPESWYSWRHQLPALASAGFHAVAPDMRGYGQTDRPDEMDKYTLLHLVGDMTGLLDSLGENSAVIAGHDWGAAVAWASGLLRPDRFRAVIALSVPFRGRGPSRSSRACPASTDSDRGELVVPSRDGERHRGRRVRSCDGRHHEDRRRHRLDGGDGTSRSGGAAVIKPHLCRAERACDGRRADGFLV